MADSGTEENRLAIIGSAFLAKVAQRLTTIDPDTLDPADLPRWIEVALKLEQAGSSRKIYDRAARLNDMEAPPTEQDRAWLEMDDPRRT